MATETIELLTKSRFEGAQLDRAIERYEKLERLSGKLGTITVRFNVEGLSELKGAHEAMTRIAATRGFEHVNRDVANLSRNLVKMRNELNAAEREHLNKSPAAGAKPGRNYDLEKLRLLDMRQSVEETHAELQRLQKVQSQIAKGFASSGGGGVAAAVAGPAAAIAAASTAAGKLGTSISGMSDKLASTMDTRMQTMVQSVERGMKLMETGGARLERSQVKMRATEQGLVATRSVSEMTTGAGELMKVTRNLGRATTDIDLKVNEGTRRMAEAMRGLNPELRSAARTMSDSMTVAEARAKGVTREMQAALQKAGALPESGRTTKEFREAARSGLAEVKPFDAQTAAARKLAEAEQSLAARAERKNTAMQKQPAHLTAAGTAAGVTAGKLEQTRKAEENLAGAASERARIYQRVNEKGKVTEEKFQEGPGVTRVERGSKAVTTTNDLARATESLAATENNYRRALKQSGADLNQRLKVSEDFARSLRRQRDEQRAYTGTPMFAGMEKKLAGAEAAVADAQNKIRERERAASEALQRQRSAALVRAQEDQQRATDSLQSQRSAALVRERQDRDRATEALQRQRSTALVAQGRLDEKEAQKAAEHSARMAKAAATKAGVTLGPDFKEVSRAGRVTSGRGRSEEVTFEKTGGATRERITLMERFNEAGQHVETQAVRTERAVRNLAQTSDWSARSFIKNSFVVAAWAGSVAAVYSSFNLLSAGASAAVELERKTATLRTVFRGSAEDAYVLRDSVLELAVAQGRSSDEALDAAIRFSRLGLSRVQVLEAVTVALKAANVAEITTGQAAEYLSAIMVGYNLNVKDLRGTLDQLNVTSNRWNTTNKDMLEGMARVSALARQARLPLSELMGVIAAGTGATGRPGQEIGTALKAMIVAVSTSSVQTKLKERFQFDVKDDVGDIKDFSTVLGELYVRYNQLTDAERQEMLQRIGGKQQASRIAVILDQYVRSQVLAIQAQTTLNSAERENQNIRATMLSQLQSLSSEFQRLAVNLVASGESSVATGLVQNTVKGITNAMSVLSDAPGVTGVMLGLFVMMTARLALMSLEFAGAGGQANFFSNTLKHGQLIVRGFAASVNSANREMAMSGGVMGAFAGGALRFASGTRALTAGLPVIAMIGAGIARMSKLLVFAAGTVARFAGGILTFAALEGGIWLVNKAFSAWRGNTEAQVATLAGLNAEVERHTQFAAAAAQSSKLFTTISKAAPFLDRRGFQMAAEGVAQVASPDDPERQRTIAGELIRMREREGAIEQVQARLAQLKAEADGRARAERELALRATQTALTAEREALRIVQAQIAARQRGGRPADREREQEKGIRDRIETLSGQQTAGLTSAVDEVLGDMEGLSDKVADAISEGAKRGFESFSGKVPALESELPIERELSVLRAREKTITDETAAANRKLAEAREAANRPVKAARANLETFNLEKTFAEKYAAEAAATRKAPTRDERFRAGIPTGWGLGFPDLKLGEKFRNWQSKPLFGSRGQAEQAIDPAITREQKLREAIQSAEQAASSQTRAMEENAGAIEKRNQVLQESINADRAAAEAKRRSQEGERAAGAGIRDAGRERSRGAIGLTEGERLLNQSRFLGQSSSGLDGQLRGQNDLLSQIRVEIQMREQLRQLEENLNSARDRGASIEAEKRNLQAQQNVEASKSLLLASREDQLQAALLAKFLQKRGGKGFSLDEFQFLDQRTRQGIERNAPDKGPIQLNTGILNLDREAAAAARAMAELPKIIEEAKVAVGRTNPEETLRKYEGENPNKKDLAVGINVNVGSVVVDIGAQAAAMVAKFQDAVVASINPQFTAVYAAIDAIKNANPVSNGVGRS